MGALSIAGHYIIPGRGDRNKIEDFVNDFVTYRMLSLFQPYPLPWKPSLQDVVI